MATAALNSYDNNNLAQEAATMHMAMIVNAKGKACLLHDEPFENTPLWVKYKKLSRKIEILFDNGSSMEMPHLVPDNVDSYLSNSSKVSIIRVVNKNPVEGWETILLNDSYN